MVPDCIETSSVQKRGVHLIPVTTATELQLQSPHGLPLSNIYTFYKRGVVGDRLSQPVESGVRVGHWDIRCMPWKKCPWNTIKHAASESFTLARKNATFYSKYKERLREDPQHPGLETSTFLKQPVSSPMYAALDKGGNENRHAWEI